MTLFDLVMSCDNVNASFEVEVRMTTWEIAPRYKFTLSEFIDNTDLYEESKSIKVNHFMVSENHMIVFIY